MPPSTPLDLLCINTVRTLAMDAVQKANSGHPGTPMALAPLGYSLFTQAHEARPGRSALARPRPLRALVRPRVDAALQLPLSQRLRPHPRGPEAVPPVGEPHAGPSRSTATRPASRRPPARSARASATRSAWRSPRRTSPRRSTATGTTIVDHYTYFICSDGDLMEGISHEAASFAGHFKLGKLIGFYDDNRITIDGSTDLTFTDDTAKRFEALRLAGAAHRRRERPRRDRPARSPTRRRTPTRPTMVVTRTHIGYGSPNKQDTATAHGEPLGADEIVADQEGARLAEPDEPLLRARRGARALARGEGARRRRRTPSGTQAATAYAPAFPRDAKELRSPPRRRAARRAGRRRSRPSPRRTATSPAAPRRARCSTRSRAMLPELMGGSADLTPIERHDA